MKRCTKCGRWKVSLAFNNCKRSFDGIDWMCKACDKLYRETIKDNIRASRARHFEKNRDKRELYLKNYRELNRDLGNSRARAYSRSNALYAIYKDKLTVDEEPRIAEDGISLEVRCKYCGQYFIPTNSKVRRRIQSLNDTMQGTQFLYCSDECKNLCPVFNQKKYVRGLKPTTSREVDSLIRKLCFELDEWECQRCGKTESLICHHILGYTQYKALGNDVANTITFCEDCHKWVHSFLGCRYTDLKCKL